VHEAYTNTLTYLLTRCSIESDRAPQAVETRDLPDISAVRRHLAVVVVVAGHRLSVSSLSLVVVSASSTFRSRPPTVSQSTHDEVRQSSVIARVLDHLSVP